MRDALRLVVSMIGAVALTVALLVTIGVIVVAAGGPTSLSGAMHSNSEDRIRGAMGEAQLILWGLHSVAYPLIAIAVGWLSGMRERGARAAVAASVGLLPLVTVVLFVGSMRTWAIGLACTYVVLGVAMSRMVPRFRAS